MDGHIRQTLIDASRATGSRIMQDWHEGRRAEGVGEKPDGSPVTKTDDAAEAMIVASILSVSDHPIIAEEAVHHGRIPDTGDGVFWLVDALDGTREFIAGRRDFTVNIALIDHGVPVFGIIHAPVSGITWHATAGQGAYRIENGIETRIHMAAADAQSLRLLAGKRSAEPVVLEPFVGPHAVVDRKLRSSSLKFCLIAEGAADLYPRLIQTFEWDTAAGDIIVREAGGAVLDLATRLPMIYGKQHLGFENNGFIAGSRTLFKNIVIPAQAGIHGKE